MPVPAHARLLALFLAAVFASAPPLTAPARALDAAPAYTAGPTYTLGDLVTQGHRFFGNASGNIAVALSSVLSRFGEPVGYVLGEEGSGALIGGLRYGEGALQLHGDAPRMIFWQGPSVGWDFGGSGSRVMMLVYNAPNAGTLYQRFTGVDGSAFLVGGMSMTVLAAGDTYLIPVRTGVGARLGVSIGYLKFTAEPTWNPF